MKTTRFLVSILMIALLVTMSGCVYSNNKDWDDLSAHEQQDVKQALDDAREEIQEDFSNDTVDFALDIVDKAEQSITKSDTK